MQDSIPDHRTPGGTFFSPLSLSGAHKAEIMDTWEEPET
jgi:hypothetical protein